MITIEYAENGQAVSDFNYKDWLDNVKANIGRDHTFIVSTSIPIYAVRLAIVLGEIDFNEIVFKYSNEVFQANKYGAIERWPLGFCDLEVNLATDILRYAMKKRRRE
jgi:hypothetical protein